MLQLPNKMASFSWQYVQNTFKLQQTSHYLTIKHLKFSCNKQKFQSKYTTFIRGGGNDLHMFTPQLVAMPILPPHTVPSTTQANWICGHVTVYLKFLLIKVLCTLFLLSF